MADEATVTASATPPPAAAEKGGDKEFGNAGVINFAAATSLGLAFSSVKPPAGDSGSKSDILIQPSIDYFVAEGISVGALLGLRLQSEKAGGASDADTATTIAIGPRVGYNLWLTPGNLSLWPTLGISYSTTSTKSKGNDGPSLSAMTLNIFVPLVIHPVKHFHLAVGPFMDMDLSSKVKPPSGDSVDGNKTTTFGLKGEIAGWL